MAERVSSKVVTREVPPAVRRLVAVPTGRAAFVGITERGPFGSNRVTDFEGYRRLYGGYVAGADLPLAVLGFFENGGQELYISRTAHYLDITDPDSHLAVKAAGYLVTPGAPTQGTATGTVPPPVSMSDGDTLIVDVDAGGNVTATFNGSDASGVCVNSEPFALADLQTLDVVIDNGVAQTITFYTADFVDIANATAEEVAAAINNEIIGASSGTFAGGTRVTISSDRIGTGSRVQVTGGTASAAFGFPVSVVGTGDFSDSTSVTFSEIKTLVEADIPGLTVQQGTGGVVEIVSNKPGGGPTSSIQVDATSTLDTVLGLDNLLHSGLASGSANAILVEGRTHGAYGNNVTAKVQPASNAASTDFNLVIEKDGIDEETFANLSPDPTALRYFETIVNADRTGSVLVALTDQGLPLNPRPSDQEVTLTGGDDGLTGLADTDFLGDEDGETGLHAFDVLRGSYTFSAPGRATPLVHTGVIDYVEIDREGDGFVVNASDEGDTADDIATYAETNLEGYSEFGALYWPRVKIINPDKGVFGSDESITVAPEGHIAGMFARVDASRTGGVYVPPAGTTNGVLLGVVGLDTDDALKEKKRDLVASRLVNPLNKSTGTRFYVDGVDTCRVDYNFPSVSERRGVNFIEDTIEVGMDIYRFRNNDTRLRAEVDRTIYRFLLEQMNLGAFRTTNPDEAFAVIVSDDPDDIFANLLKVSVLLATQKPTKFIEVNYSQDTRALQTAQA